MKLGSRVSFSRIEDLEPHLEGVDFPIELGLPYRVDRFLPVAGRMEEVRNVLQDRGIEVQSLHAPQGNLALDGWQDWARPTMWLADELGAHSVTFHPGRTRSRRQDAQLIEKERLVTLQHESRAVAALDRTDAVHLTYSVDVGRGEK